MSTDKKEKKSKVPEEDEEYKVVKMKGPSFDFNFRYGELIDKNIEQLRTLNKSFLPVQYSETFYKGVLERGPKFAYFGKFILLTFLAYFNDVIVGAVSCRIESHNNENKLYVLTLGVLEPYRHLGIGKKLLDKALEIASRNSVVSVFLHVHVVNKTAINFYLKNDFKEMERIENYYSKIEEPHCLLLEKRLK